MNDSKQEDNFKITIIDSSPLPIFAIDAEDRVRYLWNDAAEGVFGWSKSQIMDRKLPMVPEENRAEFKELRARSLKGESIRGVQTRFRKENGELIGVTISLAPLREEGIDEAVLCVASDIQKRNDKDTTLEDSKNRYKKLLNKLNDAIFLSPLEESGRPGQFLEVNDAATEMLGYSREELLSMNPEDIDTRDELTLPGKFDDLLDRGQAKFERVQEAKDGTKIPVELSSHVIELDGRKAVLTIARDISERKETLEKVNQNRNRLQQAMEAGGLAWWSMELPSGKVDFHERKATMLGYSPGKFDHYEDFTELVHPDEYEKAMEAMKSHLEGSKERYEVEYRLEKADGGYKWFRDVGSISETTESSDHTIVTGIIMDIDNRKRAEKELARERKKLRKLHDAVDKFQQCETEEQLCHAATEATQNILNFDHCTFACFENGELVPIATTGKRDPREVPPQQLDEGPAGKAFRKDTTLTGELDQPNSWSRTEEGDLESYMSVPIGDVGVFQAASSTERGFDETAVGLAEILAGHLYEEIKRIRLEEELRKRAIRDPLTEVYNRRYFNETLEKEIERSERYDNPIGFLMIDVNRFKEINDSYSHQVGDEVLKEVADLLQENVRAADTVIRYGGDEFLVMMPETNGEINNTVERLRGELEKWNAESDLLDFPLTLAMGVSHWTPEQDIGVEETLRKADARMYRDKRD